MARRSDHSRDELKTLILNESWNIVKQDGFEGLTARKIAKNIGYAPGTIYNLFDSMNDLYLAINARTLDLLYKTLSHSACNDPNKTPRDNMKTMSLRYMHFAKEHKPYWLMLFNLKLSEEEKLSDWYQEKIDRLFDPLEKLLENTLKTSKHQNKKTAARVLWASVHGLCFLQETGKISIISEQNDSQHMAEYLIDSFLDGTNNVSL